MRDQPFILYCWNIIQKFTFYNVVIFKAQITGIICNLLEMIGEREIAGHHFNLE